MAFEYTSLFDQIENVFNIVDAPVANINSTTTNTTKTTVTSPISTTKQSSYTGKMSTSRSGSSIYSTQGVNVSDYTTGIDAFKDTTANEKLKQSVAQKNYSTISSIGSSLLGIYNAQAYLKNVKDTATQYENQKKLIDTNIMNAQSLMMDNYQENMGQLNVMAASKNVDVTSEGIQAVKDKGLMDMQSDFAQMNTQANLNKAALNLEYAMNVKSAAQSAQSKTLSSVMSIGKTLLNYGA